MGNICSTDTTVQTPHSRPPAQRPQQHHTMQQHQQPEPVCAPEAVEVEEDEPIKSERGDADEATNRKRPQYKQQQQQQVIMTQQHSKPMQSHQDPNKVEIMKFYLPVSKHGALIGTGGKNIKHLQETHNVRVTVPKMDENSTVITVQGRLKNIEALEHDVKNVTQIAFSRTPLATYKFKIPANRFGTVRSAKLDDDFDCDIQVPRGSNASGDVVAQGPPANLDRLHVKLESLLGIDIKVSKGPGSISAAKAEAEQPLPKRDLSYSPSNLIASILFFPDDSGATFNSFLSFLRAATKTVDVAIYTLTDDRITMTLEKLHCSGVRIRIITDKSTMYELGSDIDTLAKIGIQVKYHGDTEVLMHHKFAVIDDVCLLNGSFNWSRSASSGNEENVMCLNEPHIVTPYKQRFDNIWNKGVIVKSTQQF